MAKGAKSSRWLHRFEQAVRLHQSGDLRGAEKIYAELFGAGHRSAPLLGNYGSLLRASGRMELALDLFAQGAQLYPTAQDLLFNYGNALMASNRFDDAASVFEKIRSLNPAHAMAHYSLGKCLQDGGNSQASMSFYRTSIDLNPQHYDSHLNLGVAFMDEGFIFDAIASLERACAIDTRRAAAWNNLGLALQEAGEFEKSLGAYRQAFALEPSDRIASNVLMSLQYHSEYSESQLLQTAVTFGKRFEATIPLQASPNDSLPQAACFAGRQHDSLQATAATRSVCFPTLGFVSGDLFAHPVGFFFRPVLRELHRRGVKVLLYANGGRRDNLSKEFAEYAAWRDIEGRSDEAVASQVKKDGVDVLFDLSGHSSRNRLSLFALKAAPKQFTWLGYFATTGMTCFDGVIMDRWHVSDGMQSQFSEPVLRLPHSRFCYQPPDFAPPITASSDGLRGFTQFGSFNNTSKINPQVIQLWSRVLRAVPKSRLLLKWRSLCDQRFVARIQASFAAQGVDPDRVCCEGQSVHRDLLAAYRHVDIALDPFPFSGGQTSCEALWMGVPVISLPGQRPVSRQTLGFVSEIGFPQWACRSEDEYVQCAADLAGNEHERQSLRFTIRKKFAESPLCDAPQFTSSLMELVT